MNIETLTIFIILHATYYVEIDRLFKIILAKAIYIVYL